MPNDLIFRECFYCLDAVLAGDLPARTPEAASLPELAALCETLGWGIDESEPDTVVGMVGPTAPPSLKFYCPTCKLISDPDIASHIRTPPG